MGACQRLGGEVCCRSEEVGRVPDSSRPLVLIVDGLGVDLERHREESGNFHAVLSLAFR